MLFNIILKYKKILKYLPTWLRPTDINLYFVEYFYQTSQILTLVLSVPLHSIN